MKAKLIWDNPEKTLLRQVYTGNITTEDILGTARETYELLGTVPHTVHLFLELSSLSRSVQISFMEAAKDLDLMVASNQGYVIGIGGGLGLLYTVKSMEIAAPKATEKSYLVDTMEEARELLRKLTSSGQPR